MAVKTISTSCMWRQFVCPRSQLSIDTVLAAGQSFRWKKNGSGEWVGVMAGLVWKLRQTEEAILYHIYGPETASSQAGNSSCRFPEVNEGNSCQNAELPDVTVNSRVKQEVGCSREQLASESSQKKSEQKFCKSFLNGNKNPAVKLECFEGNTEVKMVNCDKLQEAGFKEFNCNDLQGEEMQVKKCSKFQDKGVETITGDELQIKKIKNNKSELLEKHKNGSRKSKRVIEKLASVQQIGWNENITDGPHVEASTAEVSRLRKNTTEVVKTSCTAQQSDNTSIKTEDFDGTSKDDLHHKLLEDYFQMSVNLDQLYEYWSSKDPHFKKVAKNFQGIRLLRLDPTECLLSFVCSSNNHISRISSMVEKLCMYYGNLITSVDGVAYYTFPRLLDLCGDQVESHLRELGFGYRAKFIASIAKHVTQNKGEGWLDSLRGSPYLEARAELLTLLGVGAKVADCVCLMSLDMPQALPVDTHVWQFTSRNYMPKLHGAKSLTEKLYNEIGDFYRDLWGSYAGWAQAVLFAADLRHNKDKGVTKQGSANKRKACRDDGNLGQQNKAERKTEHCQKRKH